MLVTGGTLYRGTVLPDSPASASTPTTARLLRGFRIRDGKVAEPARWNVGNLGSVTSFGEDADHELYAITASNKIYRIAKM